MATFRTFKTLQNNKFMVEIRTEEFSELDTNLMLNFGEPEINAGGSFTGPPAYSLSDDLEKIKSGSPFKQSFDSADFGDAEARADVWADEIIVRLKAELDTLRALADGFTGETTETY